MTSDYVVQNRDFWNAYASDWVARGEAAWRSKTAYWGIWETPEAELGLLPEALNGAVAVELGCGTGYVSRWLELRGAEVVACLLYTSPSPRDGLLSRMPSSA